MTTSPLDGLVAGARFFRGDLHIHSYEGSHDVGDASMTASEIVETALRENLSLIAITDHNEIRNVGAAIKAANGRLCVVPGVELSTPHGHLLVYFRDLKALEAYYGKLAIVDRDTGTSRCQTSLLDCLNRIDSSDGFAVLAHVDVDAGFETMVPGGPPHKIDVLTHPSLLAIELKDPSCPISYAPADPDGARVQIGSRRRDRLQSGSNTTIARILSSDSHTLTALGRNAQGARRLTRYKMDAPTFDGLVVALRDYEARVRLEDDIPASIPTIRGLRVTGGFLDAQSVRLSSNLTCIIGGRGAGKSTLFECIRVLSHNSTDAAIVDGDTWPDSLELEWCDEAGVVQRLERRKACETENLTRTDGPTTFPVECYGQGETAETSRRAQSEPGALLAYLDQFVDLADLQSEDEDLRAALLENQKRLEEATLQVDEIPKYEKLLAQTRLQIEALTKAEAKEVLELERRVADERRLRTTLAEHVDAIEENYKSLTSHAHIIELKSIADPANLRIGASHVTAILKATEDMLTHVQTAGADLFALVQKYAKAVDQHVSEWKTAERGVQNEIDKKKKELADKGIKLDFAFIQKVAQDEAKYRKNLDTLNKWRPHKNELEKVRRERLKRRWEIRGEINTRRVAFAQLANKTLQHTLTDLTVVVKFGESGLCKEAEELIQNAMGWRTVQVPRAAALVRAVTVPGLLSAIQKKDITPIRSVKDDSGTPMFTAADASELLERLSEPSLVFRLERCEVEDLPRISVTKAVSVGSSTKPLTRDFSRLSLGQQQSVLLALMLASNSRAPLLIDQPEDNLDSEFIYHSLVPILRRAKERRQVVVVTHNANIAVLGDAELVIALKGVSEKGTIVARGSIDAADIRRTACTILEGAEEAFIRRSRIYGIPKE